MCAKLLRGAAIVLCAGWLGMPAAQGQAREHVVFWNRMGSVQEIEHSEIGPGGTITGGGFTTGMFGGAYLADCEQDRKVSFPKEVIPPERGCIEFWARLTNPPPGIAWGNHPNFFQIEDGATRSNYVLMLNGNDGNGHGGLTLVAGDAYTGGTGDYWDPYTYEGLLGTGKQEDWHHYALVWDVDRLPNIGNGQQRVAAFLDGVLNTGRWSTVENNGFPQLTSGELQWVLNDNGQGSVAIDNVRIWNYAKTDFSDRFRETPLVPGDQLLLWNRFESRENLEHSDFGPDFQLTNYIFEPWQEARIEPAYFGNGLFVNHDINEGWQNDGANFFAVDLWEMGLTPERGTIEFWFKYKYDCSVSNHADFFINANELAGHLTGPPSEENCYIEACWRGWNGRKDFAFNLQDESHVPLDVRTPLGSAGPGGPLAFWTDDVHHYAFVWDVAGIAQSSDTRRIYVDGHAEAAADGSWSTGKPFKHYLYVGARPNYNGWDQTYNAVKGVTDNLKIWNYAKTDFSDRFRETPFPPAAAHWRRRATTGPSPRIYHALTYDAARGAVLLFGGNDGIRRNDTWEWNGNAWRLCWTGGPSPRDYAGMAYDAARAVTVLFGGYDGGGYGDTWEWDGYAWLQRSVSGPSPRWGAGLAYDAGRRVTVLFGGYEHSSGYLSDTWEWDGNTWTLRATSGPPGRDGHGLAYDAARRRTVLFGGYGGTCYGDTWEWDGTAWTQRASGGPSPRNYPALAYDPARGVTVLFGGQPACHYGDVIGDTWQWDGNAWTLSNVSGPAPRFAAALAADAARESVVLFGGQAANAGALLGDTWELAPSVVGDLNCDGVVDFEDINPFVLALTAWGQYLQQYPDCDIMLADINGDAYVTYADINPFVTLLTGG